MRFGKEALTSVLLAKSDVAATLSSVTTNTDNIEYEEDHAEEKHHSREKVRKNKDAASKNNRRLDAPASLKKTSPSRKLKENVESIGDIFARSYTCICLPQDFAYVIPKGGRPNSNFIDNFDDQFNQDDPSDGSNGLNFSFLGISYIQSGGCFDPADVPIVSRKAGSSGADRVQQQSSQDGGLNRLKPGASFDNTSPDSNLETGRFPFAGERQPGRIPQSDPGFFYSSQCTGVSGGDFSSTNVVTGISCLINLCLGGGGFNCLGIYSGVGYTFNPLAQVSSTEPSDNVRTSEDFNLFNTPRPFTNAPPLPPSFPGTIFGGTGSFVGAKGTVEITTVAGQTAIVGN
jgi:hypothetical protein